jgi:hypothetical protein
MRECLEKLGFKVTDVKYLFIGKYKHKLLELADKFTPEKNSEDIAIVAEKR